MSAPNAKMTVCVSKPPSLANSIAISVLVGVCWAGALSVGKLLLARAMSDTAETAAIWSFPAAAALLSVWGRMRALPVRQAFANALAFGLTAGTVAMLGLEWVETAQSRALFDSLGGVQNTTSVTNMGDHEMVYFKPPANGGANISGLAVRSFSPDVVNVSGAAAICAILSILTVVVIYTLFAACRFLSKDVVMDGEGDDTRDRNRI